jgi:hypothetical protein
MLIGDLVLIARWTRNGRESDADNIDRDRADEILPDDPSLKSPLVAASFT